MTRFELFPYQPSMALTWDAFLDEVPTATFLHSRRFLSYHKDRFRDRSLLWRDTGDGKVVAVLPAAEDPDDPATVVSHPGATFGGLLTNRLVWGNLTTEIFLQCCDYFAEHGYRKWLYKPVPEIYHSVPAAADLWALFVLDARLVRRGLSTTIALADRLTPTERRRRTLRKAMAQGCSVAEDGADAVQVWDIFTRYLGARHGVKPVHSLEEFRELARLFPDSIELYSARMAGRTVAGVAMFHSPTVAHVQYSVSSDEGTKVGAMDLLLEHAIGRAHERGARYLDFGISTDHSGKELNEGLHRFKLEFGGGTVVYDQYALSLTSIRHHARSRD